MATEPDNTEQYARLIQLLALKRCEQPPPGFFDRFPQEVRLRIMAETNPQASWISRLSREANWFNQLMAALDARPYLAGVFGGVACAAMLVGIIYANFSTPPSNTVALQSISQVTPPALAGDNAPDWAAPVVVGSTTNPTPSLMPAMLFNGSALQSQPATFDFK